MAPIDYASRYLYTIAGRMLAESAKDLSDEEIHRTLNPCAGALEFIPLAKRLRNDGRLQAAIDDIIESRANPNHPLHGEL